MTEGGCLSCLIVVRLVKVVLAVMVCMVSSGVISCVYTGKWCHFMCFWRVMEALCRD